MRNPNIVPLTIHPIPKPGPTGWTWHKLNKIAKLESGHTPSRSRPDWWGGDIPWLALPDIRKLDGQYADDTLEHTNDEGLANSSARLLPKGTVCLSRTASVGYVTILNRPMATSQDFVNWICGPELHPEFLMYTLLASRDYIRSLSSGAIHKTVYVPTVKDFQVCAPSINEQTRVAKLIRVQMNGVESAKVAVGKQLAAINALPASILRQAFSGQL
ncbi:EcoKI restriction-modification system protein HsdS [Stieleria neptunia]|uniref:EcoKI restriction-modification system protein HsdS n=1 Tax=Stieleria neptunia TaxID=2527979 RepID=A0A518HP06_9BACT|nr:restriction endonuclease subunit S [Stieleria neptunia]QDV42507.1 EcoKI restriction-modification system protein HsdS [Stieleria neptunia]